MACKNFSKYYTIVLKLSRYLPLYEDTSAIDFGPDRLKPLIVVLGPKVGNNEFDCASVCK